ncbi:DUF7146 domain-containing protein [Pararhodospirillum oryzae]|uniref:Uncharacterized protein n=1 Tax=Pararhodospirillum oryzae TaxID=478448 RepID=A0A512HAY7_9PROT|nr:toprim domain-containing protein [Pararhodospirillum oryzae]GEO82598.1 hypothetical protein ROR02_27290 [Pararhodospirillum oryzae]
MDRNPSRYRDLIDYRRTDQHQNQVNFSKLMLDVAARLLGKPTSKTAFEWRFGRHGSLAVDLRKGVWHDHEAGEGGGVLALIERETGKRGREALEWLGLDVDSPEYQREPRQNSPKPADIDETASINERIARAMRIWSEAVPILGTPAEAYLLGRGCALPPAGEDVIRWHPACPYDKGGAPCMVALMTDALTCEPRAIHRTPITLDGTRDKARPKKMLAPSHGCVIRLEDDADVIGGLGLTEGIETALAVIAADWRPVWACGCAGTLRDMPVLRIPCLTVFADNDASGTGQEAGRTCARRWADAGHEARVMTPPLVGSDFNDLMRGAA